MAKSTLSSKNTNYWNSYIGGYIYPSGPACDAMAQIQDGRKLHRISVEYHYVDANGVIQQLNAPGDGCNAYSVVNANLCKQYSNEVYTTVSGLWDDVGGSSVELLTGTAGARTAGVNALVNFVNVTAGITGVDLDFERMYAIDNDLALYNNYKSFITQLGNALHAVGKKLTITHSPFWFTPSIINVADFATLPIDNYNIMLYDHYYEGVNGWLENQGLSPDSWASYCIGTTLESFVGNESKVMCAIPSYGYYGPENATSASTFTGNQPYSAMSTKPGFATAVRDKGLKNGGGFRIDATSFPAGDSWELHWNNGGNAY